MRSCIEVVARRGAGLSTELPVVRAAGQYAVRRTGPARVHLVATAFGPLGGDDVDLRLVVEEGATLEVCTVAAAVVLPQAARPSPASRQRVHAEVAGSLLVRPEPTVVAARAEHVAEVVVRLGPEGELELREQVLLGRTGEQPGRWTGTTRVERAGRPLLHTTVGLGPGAPAWTGPVAPRAYASALRIAAPHRLPEQPQSAVATGQDAVRLPLPGGWVSTAWAADLTDCTDRLAALEAGSTPAE